MTRHFARDLILTFYLSGVTMSIAELPKSDDAVRRQYEAFPYPLRDPAVEEPEQGFFAEEIRERNDHQELGNSEMIILFRGEKSLKMGLVPPKCDDVSNAEIGVNQECFWPKQVTSLGEWAIAEAATGFLDLKRLRYDGIEKVEFLFR